MQLIFCMFTLYFKCELCNLFSDSNQSKLKKSKNSGVQYICKEYIEEEYPKKCNWFDQFCQKLQPNLFKFK